MTTTKYQLVRDSISIIYTTDMYTVMTATVQRDDGIIGDVQIVAGVPDYMRGEARAAGTQQGYMDVWAYGDCPEHWCSDSLAPPDGDYEEVLDGILSAVWEDAIRAHEDPEEEPEEEDHDDEMEEVRS
jgi:hypothetical protein